MYNCQILSAFKSLVSCTFKKTIIHVYKYQHGILSEFTFFNFQVLFEFSLYINTVNCDCLRYMKLEVNGKFI